MKLLHILNYEPLGSRAIDHFILEYARQGNERGWQIRFAFTAEPPTEFAEQLRTLQAAWSVYGDLRELLKLPPVDVVHTSFHSAFERGILKLKRSGFTRKLIIIDHSSGEGPSPHGVKSWLRRLRGWRVGRIVDRVVCVSHYNARRDIERVFLPASKVCVVPNGIDLERFPIAAKQNAILKVVYVGQLIAEKGVGILIDAVKRLPAPSFEVQIAGSGTLRESLETSARGMANVRFLGQVADVAALYRSADVLVIPSLWAEAFGLVAIEAMASGAVVLASNAGALPEVIGDAGAIFEKGNIADLAAKLQILLDDASLRERLRLAARTRVEQHYQLDQCVERHLKIVEEIQS